MVLYRIIIQPVEYLIELLYTVLYRFFESPGFALIMLSIAVSFILLPLYLRSDAMQEAERKKQDSMRGWMEHIRRSFHGDERAMMQTAYYGIMHYHPLSSLRGAISLLLQIPFFIAAYHFLSELDLLRGRPFGPIADLGAADGLLRLGDLRVNILPILMTLINIISTMIYTKGFGIKEKMQPYILSLVFFILLYDRPSGLVIYWTMNNLFSLLKNIAMGPVIHKRRLLSVLLLFCSVPYLAQLISAHKIQIAMAEGDHELVLYYLIIALLFFVPVAVYGVRQKRLKRENKKEEQRITYSETDRLGRGRDKLVVFTSLCLFVLFGALIPLSLIYASPMEFVNEYHFRNPLFFVWTSLCTWGGTFLLWGAIIYHMLDRSARDKYSCLLLLGLFAALPTYMFFRPKNVKTIRLTLQWLDGVPRFEMKDRILNLLLIVLIFVIVLTLWKRAKKIFYPLSIIVLLSLVFMCGSRLYGISKVLKENPVDERLNAEYRHFTYSETGKNVIVIMLDRAIGTYIPYIFDQYPELYEKFDGFTYYPNTSSFGLKTKFGAPALFGGYDYTPEEMNERSEESLEQKHDEALRMLPRIFGEEGYHVTLCDLPYAGYTTFGDYSVFDQDQDIELNAFHLQKFLEGGYSLEETWKLMERNFYFYSLYKTVPVMLQDEVYDEGEFLKADESTAQLSDSDHAAAWSALSTFAADVECQDEENCLILFNNHTTHDPVELQLPDYTQEKKVDNSSFDVGIPREYEGRYMGLGYEEKEGLMHYQVNVAAFLKLSEWLDELRSKGIYDRCRIIIVSDHGQGLAQFEDLVFTNGVDVEAVNALLLVKDFDDSQFRVDTSFMTNGDVPALATDGLIAEPKNPFTGNEISMEAKKEGINIIYSQEHNLTRGNVFAPEDDIWYHLAPGNIADESNWTRIR